MNWDELMQVLDEQQKYLQAFVDASKEHHERVRPGRDFDSFMSAKPDMLLQSVETNHAHQSALLAAAAFAQVKFNQAVISLLIDLDHRKSEPNV